MKFHLIIMKIQRKLFLEYHIPIVAPACLVSFGNNSSPSGHVTAKLSGSLIEKGGWHWNTTSLAESNWNAYWSVYIFKGFIYNISWISWINLACPMCQELSYH